ncbi:MAG TPA: hypothetical protein VIG30_13930 [Ktedonobacterales bacterium]|jgi:hypothetical protein
METTLDKRCGEQHAITDIYCAKRQRSLVVFPGALIGLLVVGGVAAFLLTGFVGYANCVYAIAPGSSVCWHDAWSDFLYLKEPWPIYLWASAVMLTVQVAILRDPSLRRRLVLALVATLLSIAIVGIVYLFGSELLDWLKQNYRQTLTEVVTSPTTYAIINFGIIALYALGSAFRWIRHPRGLTVVGARAIPRRETGPDEATLEELISGDLITGVVLFFVMSLIFTDSVIGGFVKYVLDQAGPANVADVPVSLSTADVFLALLCLFMGFMALALTGLLAGLRVLQDQANPAASKAAGRVSSEVVLVILNALRAAFTRQLRNIARRVGYTSRRALWPLLLLSGSFCLALFGRYVLYYLHDTGSRNIPVSQTSQLLNLLFALGLGVAGVLATILSTALQLRSWRVAANAFGFLRWVGVVALITFWIFAVSLFAFDVLLVRLGVVPGNLTVPPGVPATGCAPAQWYNLVLPLGSSCNQPFVPLSYPTLVSFVAFLVVVGILLVRLRQGMVRRVPSPAASTTAHGMRIPEGRGVRTADEGR